MKFSELLGALQLDSKIQGADFQVAKITSDSRAVQPGSVFVAIVGSKSDGHQYLSAAVASGASALVVQSEDFVPRGVKASVLKVTDSRRFLDRALAIFWGEPTRNMICVGVTGTNGKTTTTHLIEQALNSQGLPTAVMGTIDHHLGDRRFESELTTPGPEILHQRHAEFLKLGAKAVAMEVSSHALEQHRADSVHFDVGVFTNLTRDHLDYHGTMENYFLAKQKLFDEVLWNSFKPKKFAIVNEDDHYGRRIKTSRGVETVYYGRNAKHVRFEIFRHDLSGLELNLYCGGKREVLKTHLIGVYNAYNLSAALGVVHALGFDLYTSLQALSEYAGVRGRLERVPNSKGVHVFVDYAHTDDALTNSLGALKEIRDTTSPDSRLICVFGCGGDRDAGKRPMMAKASQALADQVVVTSDNPRTEDPDKIIQEILVGFAPEYRNQKVTSLVERKRGIESALQMARPGDVVLVAGKGHEDYQIIGNEKRHFSDVEVVREALK